jgi:tRNA threonylcarbamoyladenosine biosynthesis protein TsaB
MAIIINIDTAQEHANVCISHDTQVLAQLSNDVPKSHASFVHQAIQQLLQKTHYTFEQIDAFAVINGPGSYTGLRVGLASAKGLCYALNKPLILVNTLELMAYAAITSSVNSHEYLYCPMIDARRMEVFYGVYTHNLTEKIIPESAIVDASFLNTILAEQNIVFLGSGSAKWQQVCNNSNALFTQSTYNFNHIAQLTHKKYLQKDFGNVAYSQPFYIKEAFVMAQN